MKDKILELASNDLVRELDKFVEDYDSPLSVAIACMQISIWAVRDTQNRASKPEVLYKRLKFLREHINRYLGSDNQCNHTWITIPDTGGGMTRACTKCQIKKHISDE